MQNPSHHSPSRSGARFDSSAGSTLHVRCADLDAAAQLRRLPGVLRVVLTPAQGYLSVRYDPAVVDSDMLHRQLWPESSRTGADRLVSSWPKLSRALQVFKLAV
jgi:hypothetical protein